MRKRDNRIDCMQSRRARATFKIAPLRLNRVQGGSTAVKLIRANGQGGLDVVVVVVVAAVAGSRARFWHN